LHLGKIPIGKNESGKRSKIHPLRLQSIKKANAVYIITCLVGGCPCALKNNGCERGFFSLFIQAINGIDFSLRHGIVCYIDFGNGVYRYSDPQKFAGNLNFWDYYFHQPFLESIAAKSPVSNSFYEIYPLRIWSRRYFRRIHRQVMPFVRWKESARQFLMEQTTWMEQQTVLGIHIRATDHATEIKPVKFTSYIKVIERYLPKYDKLFVATDDENILTILKQRFGNKVIVNDVTRSKNEIALHADNTHENRYLLGLEAMLDCYSLSKCNKALLVSSNLSYAALFFNPELDYILLESDKSIIKRWKTKLLYYLDRWNIRKW
jgi:hypothetical protein